MRKKKKEKSETKRKILGFRSLKERIQGGFGIVLLLVLVMGITTVLLTQNMNQNTKNLLNQDLELLIADEQLANNVAQQNSLVLAYAMDGKKQFKEIYDEVTESSNTLQDYILSHSDSKEARELIERSIAWRELVEKEIFPRVERNNLSKAQAIAMQKVVPESVELSESFKQMAQKREQSTKQAGQDVINKGSQATLISIILSIIIVVLSVLISIVTANAITKPIKAVTKRMKQIVDGDIHQEPLAVKSKDEVGQLTISINSVNENLKTIFKNLGEVAGTVNAHGEELSHSALEVKTGMEQVSATMQELAAGAEVQATSAGDISETMRDLITKIEEANENGEKVQSSSSAVLSLTHKGSELMETSSQQMSKIDRIVQDAVTKMDSLDKQSQEITNLVSVINGIANQTNLLALNAAIEAARAGEHGKGFAVVADEVRKLAEQVGVSVKEITDIVEKMQQETNEVANSLCGSYAEVEKGTKDIQATVETFGEIQQSVNQMVNNFQVINTNLETISSNTVELNTAIAEIASITEEASAGIEQTSASSQLVSNSMEEVVGSSEELAKLAETLNSMVNQISK